MHSVFCLLAFILLSFALFGQNNPSPEAYKKFSQLLLLPERYPSQHKKIAGGCFIKDSGIIYFVTLAHYFNGIDVFTGQPYPEKDQPDSVYIRHFDNRSSQYTLLKLNLRDYRKNARPFFWDDYPDILCMKLPDGLPLDFDVIPIDDCPYDLNIENPEEVFVWGYSEDMDSSSLFQNKDYGPKYYSASVRGNIQDPLWDYHRSSDELDFLIIPNCGAGCYGAPAFFKYNKNGNTTISFGGIVIGVDPNHGVSCIVRPQQIRKAISSLKNSGLIYYYPAVDSPVSH